MGSKSLFVDVFGLSGVVLSSFGLDPGVLGGSRIVPVCIFKVVFCSYELDSSGSEQF